MCIRDRYIPGQKSNNNELGVLFQTPSGKIITSDPRLMAYFALSTVAFLLSFTFLFIRITPFSQALKPSEVPKNCGKLARSKYACLYVETTVAVISSANP